MGQSSFNPNTEVSILVGILLHFSRNYLCQPIRIQACREFWILIGDVNSFYQNEMKGRLRYLLLESVSCAGTRIYSTGGTVLPVVLQHFRFPGEAETRKNYACPALPSILGST